ncbi:MAG: hypothetical protein NVS9B15_06850 [Acidobacteriaceae bacterium]
MEAHIRNAAAEFEQRVRENEQLAVTLATSADLCEQLEMRSGAVASEASQIRLLVEALDVRLKAERAELDTIRDRRTEFAARSAKLTADLAHLRETCLNELSVSADELCTDTGLELMQGEALAEADMQQRELKVKLDAMGPVNMMALDEYKETAQRHGLLDAQRQDLMQAIENMQNSIREIDEISREKFEEAFGKINENFQVTFRKLFGGGQGFLRLTDPENVTESGIDIIASPPGKKLQNVLLLSGGEKALTALSLLVGIFQHVPAPFCILDEVDAPLDDTNVGRFIDLIREMSSQTQFIVITHHKRTMAAAPVMYGVTMQEPGVSKIVSVKFGAEQYRHAATA